MELLDLIHAWLLKELPGNRLRILTQESQIGKPAAKLAGTNIMIDGHQSWFICTECKEPLVIEALKTRENRCRIWSYNDFSLYAVHRPDGLPLKTSQSSARHLGLQQHFLLDTILEPLVALPSQKGIVAYTATVVRSSAEGSASLCGRTYAFRRHPFR